MHPKGNHTYSGLFSYNINVHEHTDLDLGHCSEESGVPKTSGWHGSYVGYVRERLQ